MCYASNMDDKCKVSDGCLDCPRGSGWEQRDMYFANVSTARAWFMERFPDYGVDVQKASSRAGTLHYQLRIFSNYWDGRFTRVKADAGTQNSPEANSFLRKAYDNWPTGIRNIERGCGTPDSNKNDQNSGNQQRRMSTNQACWAAQAGGKWCEKWNNN